MDLVFNEEEIKCNKCYNGYTVKVGEDGNTFAVPCECMMMRKIARQLKKSGVSPTEYASKTLANFKADTESAKRMKEVATNFLADKKARGFGAFGKSGTGKTHICIAVCLALTLERGEEHYYFSYREEMQRLTKFYYDNQNEYERLLKKWKSCKNLYIDDLFKNSERKDGKVDTLELRIVYDIVNARYLNKVTTIFSSEYSVMDMKNIDEAIASRIYDMIKPYGIKCEGKNRRFG